MTGPIMVDIDGLELSAEDREVLKHPLTGGAILFARNYNDPAQLRSLVSDIQRLKTPALIVAVDQEGGRVQRFRESFVKIPPMSRFGQLYDEAPERARQLAEDCGWVMASELREAGVDLDFAPVVDLDYGCSEVIGDRAFHSDPHVVGQLAQSLIGGMHSAGIATCAKHFPGHGAVVADSHLELPVDDRALAAIERDLVPFRAMIKCGIESIMTAHVVMTCLDRNPVSFSTRWLNDVLRNEFGFRGVIFSDDLSMKGADCTGGIVEKARRALAAGCDFLPVCNDRQSVNELYSSDIEVSETPNFEALRGRTTEQYNFRKTKRYEIFTELTSQMIPT